MPSPLPTLYRSARSLSIGHMGHPVLRWLGGRLSAGAERNRSESSSFSSQLSCCLRSAAAFHQQGPLSAALVILGLLLLRGRLWPESEYPLGFPTPHRFGGLGDKGRENAAYRGQCSLP
jgi:hypothetical protein